MIGAPLALYTGEMKTMVSEIDQNLEIQVVATDEQDPRAWDKACDVVVECLLSLLRIKVQDNDQSDEGQKNGFD